MPPGHKVFFKILCLGMVETVAWPGLVVQRVVLGMTKIMGGNLYFAVCDNANPSKDKVSDSLLYVQDHTEQGADVDQDDSQLPDSAVPQHPPHASQGSSCPDVVPSYSIAGFPKNHHSNQSTIVGIGYDLITKIDKIDPLSGAHDESHNIYYPFTFQAEWELAEWLLSSSLPQSSVNEFLHLDWVGTIDQTQTDH